MVLNMFIQNLDQEVSKLNYDVTFCSFTQRPLHSITKLLNIRLVILHLFEVNKSRDFLLYLKHMITALY